MQAVSRRYLVVVRAGERSLHRDWMVGGDRNWDLIVSWYGDVSYQPVADERVLYAKGGKWDVLHRQLTDHPELIRDYDYIWLPDDDIEANCERINRLFDLTAAHSLAVSQPSLTPNSYHTYIHTLHCPSFDLRYTNLVEVMAPCISLATLCRVLPHFVESPSGFGLDVVWTRLEQDNRRRSAIIDAVAVRHTRPVGVFLMGRLMQSGHDPYAALARLRHRFGLDRMRHEYHCYGGISKTGRSLGRATTWLLSLFDYLRQAGRRVDRKPIHDVLNQFRFVYRPTALSTLTEQNNTGRP